MQAVLFDLDGTLLDTVRDIGACANHALTRYGCPPRPMEDYRVFIGNGIRQLFRRAVPEEVPEETFAEILGFYLRYYPEHAMEQTTVFPGIPELLAQLAAAGLRTAVITNKTQASAQAIIGHYFPDHPFAFVWGRTETRPLKPDPAAGRLACETLGLRPEEIVFFGDGDADMGFARNAGFRAIGCDWGYRSREQLLQAGAETVVSHPRELPPLLGLCGTGQSPANL